jgi:hypothetical protein
MIYHPSIIALLLGSLFVSLMVLYASRYGVLILKKWDLRSGSELQLSLERRTYLISTIMTYALGLQLFSLFLYVYTADRLHILFVGAMCAAGTLNINGYGYPTILLKCANFLLAGLWLIVNHADNRSPEYPLIRKKYLLLLVLAPFLLAEAYFQARYFLGLKPDVITSCCGSLFSAERQGVPVGIAHLPRTVLEYVFFLGMGLTLASGGYFFLRGKGGALFSAASALVFPVSILALISFISPYFYELPFHHCPFCILQKEYGFVGYLLYVTLLGGAVFGVGSGAIQWVANVESLKEELPKIRKRLALLSVILYSAFTAVAAGGMILSGLRLS